MITSKAYSEIFAIINLMSESLRNKIPKNILKGIEEKRDREYTVKIKNIKEYEISEQANKLLAVLYKNYFASDEEKEIIKAKERILFERKQKELQKKYNSNNIFGNKKS